MRHDIILGFYQALLGCGTHEAVIWYCEVNIAVAQVVAKLFEGVSRCGEGLLVNLEAILANCQVHLEREQRFAGKEDAELLTLTQDKVMQWREYFEEPQWKQMLGTWSWIS